MAICPNQLGQIAALWGLRNLADWVAGERLEILARRHAMEAGLRALEGWETLGCGAYFAYVRHPSRLPSPEFARQLVQEAGVLLLPGTMFTPLGDADGARQLRIAFANVDQAGISALMGRLAGDLSGLIGAPVLNMYGPTETTIWSSVEATTGAEGVVNIGGEWFYEEYTRSSGVRDVGLQSPEAEAGAPSAPSASEKSDILDMFGKPAGE